MNTLAALEPKLRGLQSPRRVHDDDAEAVPRRWAWRIGRLAGIEIRIHATFLVLLAWLALSHLMQGHGAGQAIGGVVFTLAVFGAVVLHEMGHALVARRFGVRTRDITLWPIGGIASLERMPEKPSQELLVALAGPAVNVAIAGVLLALLLPMGEGLGPTGFLLVGGPFLAKLMWVNLSLAVFNLLPAFPMDGGRILRAVLSFRMPRARATAAAAQVGRYAAVLLAVAGLLWNPMLLLIALFVWLAAGQEAAQEQAKALLDGIPVGRAMATDFRSLARGDRLGRAKELVLAGFQQDFPVLDDGVAVGVLTKERLLCGLAEAGADAPLSDWLRTDFVIAAAAEPLVEALARLHGRACSTLLVVSDGKVVGLVTPDNVGELLMFEAARRQS